MEFWVGSGESWLDFWGMWVVICGIRMFLDFGVSCGGGMGKSCLKS